MSDSIAPRAATHVDERAELIETLAALLFQERLLSFADQLEDEDLTIFEARMLEARPESISTLAARLGLSERKVKARVKDLEVRMRDALREPEVLTH